MKERTKDITSDNPMRLIFERTGNSIRDFIWRSTRRSVQDDTQRATWLTTLDSTWDTTKEIE